MHGDAPSLVLELAAPHLAAPDREESLRQRGFVIERQDEPTAALLALKSSRYSVAILHRSPDGIALGRTLRPLRPELGILLLGPEWALAERRRLIEEFADECLPENIEVDELAIVLMALERRASAALACGHLRWRSLALDLMGGFAVIGGVEIPLQPLQMRILACLIHHSGAVVPSEQLQNMVFRVNRIGKTSIPRQISVLRRQLGSFGAQIQTVPGGYGLGIVDRPSDPRNGDTGQTPPRNSWLASRRINSASILPQRAGAFVANRGDG